MHLTAKTITDKNVRFEEIALYLDKKIRAEAPRELVKYPKTVIKDWDHDNMTFEVLITMVGSDMRIFMYPYGKDAKIWEYVSEGTKPHKIRAKPGKVLLFPSMYAPKTRPKARKTGGRGSHGPIVGTKEVNHPGSEGRGFNEEWARRGQDWLVPRVNMYIERGLSRVY